MGHCDDRGHRALWWKLSWSIVMTAVTENWDKMYHAALWSQQSWIILITGVMEHSDNKAHKAFWCQGSWSIVLTRAWSIVMIGYLGHCDEKGMEHFDDRVQGTLCWQWHGALWWKVYWSTVRKGVMDHCDDRGHGALWWQGSWSIVMTWSRNIAMTRFLEHCDERAWSILITMHHGPCHHNAPKSCGVLAWFWYQGNASFRKLIILILQLEELYYLLLSGRNCMRLVLILI